MLQVTFHKLASDKVEKLKAWMTEAQRRGDEVRETFRQETVRHEQAFLLRTGDDHILVYVMDLDDPERARRAVQDSPFKIDREHRNVMDDVVEEKLEPELLYDVRL